MKTLRIDTPLALTVLVLALGGFFIFTSASLGLLAREGPEFSSIAFTQLVGLLIGLAVCACIAHKTNYKHLRKYAFYIFILAIGLNLLLFVPGLSLTHGGATRWIDLGFITFQPSEILKIAFIIYFAAWLSGVKDKVASIKYGLLPFLIIMAVLGALLMSQSDTDTLMVIFATGLAMLIVAGGRFRDIFIMILIGALALGAVIMVRPYAKERIMTFLNPAADPLNSGYQIQQSLIAIGSGKVLGRGFGQSVQKFNYLPEPIGDSIFAVAAEEFGFFGSIAIIILFLLFGFRAMKIASKAPDVFGGLVAIGIAILILVQSFMNIGAMLGIIPLSGQPLFFVSHGGTALIIALAEAGIVLNISKYAH
jgi:cell division protein FtsW